MSKNKEIKRILIELGAKPSKSEERGLEMIDKGNYLSIFSPGVSSGGFSEIRMVMGNESRKVVATTIDQAGIETVKENVKKLNLEKKISIKLEDLREKLPYGENSFDFVYARLVLHYLSAQELDRVLLDFNRILTSNSGLFIILRSKKNVNSSNNLIYDDKTKFTEEIYRNTEGNEVGRSKRYFHTPQSITQHLVKAGFEVSEITEYKEQLYKDFMRTQKASHKDNLIEIKVKKSAS